MVLKLRKSFELKFGTVEKNEFLYLIVLKFSML